MGKLILLRHGKSMWNALNLFTGWVDVPLAQEGIAEAIQAGKSIKHIPLDKIYTSTLIRAQMTAMLAMTEHSSGKVPVMTHPSAGPISQWNQHHANPQQIIPVSSHSELNERMYGELQGLNKDETVAKFGAEQVKIWRRSYDIAPPAGESLKDTAARSIPFFKRFVEEDLKQGLNVLISAHGNSLRSIIMEIEQLSKEEVLELELPTGKPMLYQFDQGKYHKKVL